MSQDYIMRLVEQIGRMLAAIIAKRRAGEHEEAREEMEALCRQHTGLSLDTVKRSPPEAVAGMLESGGALRHGRAVLLAEILMQDAEMNEIEGNPVDAFVSMLHAFCLLSDALPALHATEQEHYRRKLDELATRLEPMAADGYVAERLRKYREAASGW